MRRTVSIVVLIILIAGTGWWAARYFSAESVLANPPYGFTNQQLITGLFQPVSIAFPPDGRMFILELIGRIRVVQPGATEFDPTPLLVMSNVAVGIGDTGQGALSITLDPNFASNGYIYIFYTAKNPARDRLSRFTVTGNFANPNSELILYQDDTDRGQWHLGGGVAFAPDGKLFVAIGDHHDESPGSEHVSQRLDSFRGKILRLNADGSIPTDNPFYDGAGPNKDAIWALGLRNPFRATINPDTGQLYIGDVGGNINETSVEEVNIGVAGANYGWPICEGSCNWPTLTDPLYSYSHNGRDASITGGVFYQGNQFPSLFDGAYFYADYAQNWIRYLTFDNQGQATSHYFEPEDGALDGDYGEIVDIKVGQDGALYYVDLGRSWDGTLRPGSIHQITFDDTNLAPVINSAIATPDHKQTPPLTAQFSGSATDPEGQPVTYTWQFGDGASGSGAVVEHTYTQKGSYNARLVVSDGVHQVFSDLIEIVVGIRPIATIDTPADGTIFRAGAVIPYHGSAIDDDGTLTPDNFGWTVVFHHEDHVHPVAGPISGTVSGVLEIPVTGHDFSGQTSYEVLLTVTDQDGIQDTTSVHLLPEKVNLNLNSQPSGLSLNFDFLTLPTPFIRDTVIDFHHTLEAPWLQTLNDHDYAFQSWSDGGDAKHLIVVPEGGGTYSANYCQSLFTSGSFEGAGWGERSRRNQPLICAEWDCGEAPAAHTGDYLVSLGRQTNDVSYVYQTISVPTGTTPVLKYWRWVESPTACGNDTFKVLFATRGRLRTLSSERLCGQSDGGWVQESLDLSSVAGRSGSLDLWLKNDATNRTDVFLDDVSLCVGAPQGQ